MDDKNCNFIYLRKFGLIGCTALLAVVLFVNFCDSFKPSGVINLSSISPPESARQSENPTVQTNQDNSKINMPRQDDPAVNPVIKAAIKLGIRSCINRINQVTSFFTANNLSGAYIFTPQDPPDQHIFSTSFELIRQDESIFYASASFSPNQDVVYDTVEYVNMSCEEVEKNIFKNLRRIGVLKKNIVLLDSGAVKVFLMPAGSGCVVIKKEVVRQ